MNISLLTPWLLFVFGAPLDLALRGVVEPLDPDPLDRCDKYDTKEPELILGGSNSVSKTLADFIGWQ